MCEATAYLLKNGQEELILKDVDVIEPDGDRVQDCQYLRGTEDAEGRHPQPEPDQPQGHAGGEVAISFGFRFLVSS